jgi:hypothetical protein
MGFAIGDGTPLFKKKKKKKFDSYNDVGVGFEFRFPHKREKRIDDASELQCSCL